MFSMLLNWLAVRSAIKDQRRQRSGARALRSIIIVNELGRARDLIANGQRAAAAATLDELLDKYSNDAADEPATASLMMDLHRLQEAERLVSRGRDRFPDSRAFQELYARSADESGVISERIRRWRAFRRRYPGHLASFLHEARALKDAGRESEADKVLAAGIRMAPQDLGLAFDYAGLADTRGNWPESIKRWQVVRDTHNNPWAPIAISRAYAALGRHSEAETELIEARKRLPTDALIVEALAAFRESVGDMEGAAATWAELRRDFPHIVRGYVAGARALRVIGEHKQAAIVEAEALARTTGG